jgi:hypothetical protein
MRRLLVLGAIGLLAAVPPAAGAKTPPPSFASEQLAGTLADDNWEPTVAADPSSGYVYQAVTGIGAHECAEHNCPGTSILVRASSDGGATWARSSSPAGSRARTSAGSSTRSSRWRRTGRSTPRG